MSKPALRVSSHIRVVESPHAVARIAAAQAFVASRRAGDEVVIVGASRGAADDVARRLAADRGATFGIYRAGFNELVGRLAAPVLARHRIGQATPLGTEAMVARAAFDTSDALEYFGAVAQMPGFPRAAARTIAELRQAGVEMSRLAGLDRTGADLAELEARVREQTGKAGLADRADVLTAAIAGASETDSPVARRPLLLLDVAIDSQLDADLVGTLIESASSVLVSIPSGDVVTRGWFDRWGLRIEGLPDEGASPTLARLTRYLFSTATPPAADRDDIVSLFSAPGEGRECLEIARRILDCAAAGIRFDEMAVLVRSPQQYVGLLEHACTRAGIPAWFDRGTSRPDPAGRALLALLACADEDLSARRFAEYLSLAQVPTATEAAASRAGWVGPAPGDEPAESDDVVSPPELDSVDPDAAIVDGALRTPWRWERLLVDARLIHYRERWHRRLAGLDAEFARKLDALAVEEPESPRILAVARERESLRALQAFALPIVDALADWPATDSWEGWLTRLQAMVPRVLRRPARVQRVLAELAPLGEIGPVTLREVRDVLADRLRTLPVDPPARRYGRVFVGSPHQARGRTFRVVFVPGLAERLFPQRPHEDPLLLDARRDALDVRLPVQSTRSARERLLLQLALGTATERVYLSYPSLELGESRPRVPSFYALDVVRAVTGTLPGHEALARDAAKMSGARLAWPAPLNPEAAIDDLEHDLSVLARLFSQPEANGHAHYLLRLNPHLRRAVIERWSRARPQWSPADGLTRVTDITGPILAARRLTTQPYSLSALQRYAACPYQFLLAAIYRLAPSEEPEPLQRLDPLTRGSLFHAIQAEFFRTLEREGRLPIAADVPSAARKTLTATVRHVADQYRDELAPAVARVWDDEVRGIERDLLRWLEQISPEPDGWEPAMFEFAFGLPDDGTRDPRSVQQPARIDGRFQLRGSIDLVERHPATGRLRVTDHKTGKNRTTGDQIIAGGTVLQPVLYGLALEDVLGVTVQSGRLFFCTAAGGYESREIPLLDRTRGLGIEALEIVDRAIEMGRLAAAPAEGACDFCDFRPVCGPHEARRTGQKHPKPLADLHELRSRP